MTYKALLVEDDTAIAAGVKLRLRSLQHQIDCAESMEEARDFLARSCYSYIILDLGLPVARNESSNPLNGQNLLDEIITVRGNNLWNAVIVLTGQNDNVDLAVKLMQRGALDFVCKRIRPEKSENTIDQVVKKWIDEAKLVPAAALPHDPASVIAPYLSPEELDEYIKRLASNNCSLLLTGETGTGKEHIAKKIHTASSRSHKPFMALNCAGLTKDRFEAELFGYRKGAFTGADRDRPGLATHSTGGTILLDEIGDLPSDCQANLLRFLQDKEIRPLGGLPEKVDVRILAATNKPGKLPTDAIHRFDMTFQLPPLRQRRNEIPELAKVFFESAKVALAKPSLRITKTEIDKLAELPFCWPGNIRQLQKAILHAALLHDSGRDLTAEEVVSAAIKVNYVA